MSTSERIATLMTINCLLLNFFSFFVFSHLSMLSVGLRSFKDVVAESNPMIIKEEIIIAIYDTSNFSFFYLHCRLIWSFKSASVKSQFCLSSFFLLFALVKSERFACPKASRRFTEDIRCFYSLSAVIDMASHQFHKKNDNKNCLHLLHPICLYVFRCVPEHWLFHVALLCMLFRVMQKTRISLNHYKLTSAEWETTDKWHMNKGMAKKLYASFLVSFLLMKIFRCFMTDQIIKLVQSGL